VKEEVMTGVTPFGLEHVLEGARIEARREALAPLLVLAADLKSGTFSCAGRFMRLHQAIVDAADREESTR
jgi:hypothetical protein